MGFIDDVEWILEQIPEKRQIVLFSATLPNVIRRIAQQHLNDPEEITIKVKTTTAETIRQRYWLVSGLHKLDALTRILEAESFDGIIIFVRTKIATQELAEKLQARGYATAALNGDIAQKERERTIDNIKNGKLDILVATDVAARGLDVERISHVINYDIPYDTEAYVHRIGRTGRAGRAGDAILFVAPRERRLLRAIEQATRKKIDLMELPTTDIINDKRIATFKEKITDTLATEELGFYYQLVEQIQQEHNVPALEIAAALAKLVQGDQPFLLQNRPDRRDRSEEYKQNSSAERKPRRGRSDDKRAVEEGMERFRIDVGHIHGVKPGQIVGAIASEAGLEGKFIGHIKIHDEFSFVELPEGMPNDIFQDLKKTRVCGRKLNIEREIEGASAKESERPPKKKRNKKPSPKE
jgi:ATP-dependent RNA helicase DeaD